jgi:hypothetical protein
LHPHVVAAAVARLTDMERHVQVGHEMDHEAQGHRAFVARGGGIAQHCGEVGERGGGVAFGRMLQMLGRDTDRQRDEVPRRRGALPGLIRVRALFVGPGRGFGEFLGPENLLDPRARLAADIVLRYLRGDPVSDRPPRCGGQGRDGEDRGGKEGGKAVHAVESRNCAWAIA